MFSKSLKFSGSPATKQQLFKISAKFSKNHLLMANVFKRHEYQTSGLIKMHNMSKIDNKVS